MVFLLGPSCKQVAVYKVCTLHFCVSGNALCPGKWWYKYKYIQVLKFHATISPYSPPKTVAAPPLRRPTLACPTEPLSLQAEVSGVILVRWQVCHLVSTGKLLAEKCRY